MYFLQAENGGAIKIGRTENLRRRFADLQSGSPLRLKLLGVLKGAEREEEAAIHAALDRFRLHGEWFEPARDVLALVDRTLTEPLQDGPNTTKRTKRTDLDVAATLNALF